MLHKAWNSKGEMLYWFPRSSIKFQGHTVQNITNFYRNWAFPDYRPVAAFKSLRFALLRSLFPVSASIVAVAPFIFFSISSKWSDRLPLLFMISPRYLCLGTSSRTSPFGPGWCLFMFCILGFFGFFSVAISSIRVAYSITDSTPPCPMLSLMLILFYSPYLVWILVVIGLS